MAERSDGVDGQAADAVAAGAPTFRSGWCGWFTDGWQQASSPHALTIVEAAGMHGDAEIRALLRRSGEHPRADTGFGAELDRLPTEVSVGLPVWGRGVVNRNIDTVHGSIVQAGEVDGGVHFDGFAPPEL